MLNQKFSRRELLRKAVLGGAGVVAASAVAACATPTPQIIKETVIVEKPVEKVVKETVVTEKEVTKVVEKVATQVVEKQVEKVVTATPLPLKPVEITWWQAPIWRFGKDNKTADAPPDEWVNDAIVRFNKIYPQIKVKLELIPWDQWGQKVTTAFASGQLPNLLYGGPNIQYVQAGLYDPIDDYVPADNIANWTPGIKENATFFGKLYGLPAFQNPNFFVLNKTALEKGGANLIPKDPERDFPIPLEEQMAAAFSDGKTRFFLGLPTDHPAMVYFHWSPWLKGWGVKLWDDAQERWTVADNPNAVKAIQWYADSLKKGWIIPNLPKWSDVDNFYWKKNCAARAQWPGIYAELDVAKKQGAAEDPFEMVFVPHPHQPDVKPWSVPGGPVYQIGHTNDPAKRAAAVAFALWLGTDDSNAEAWVVNGIYPATKTGLEKVKNHPRMTDVNNQWVLNYYLTKLEPEKPGEGSSWTPSQNARSSKLLNDIKPYDMFLQMFQSLLLGKMTAEEMVKESAKRINEALGAKV
ncbi:MAG: extracellular solute-binding protein [Anaerolineae bacterium]|nr:extracellular solute-binding protein [Anaerolineae bacterium]